MLATRRADLGGELGRQLAADEKALEELSRDYYVDKLIGRAEFLAAREPLERRIGVARDAEAGRGRLELLAELPAEEGELLALWERKPLAWRRRVVGALLEAVVVKPAPVRGRKRLDESRVLPEGLLWRA